MSPPKSPLMTENHIVDFLQGRHYPFECQAVCRSEKLRSPTTGPPQAWAAKVLAKRSDRQPCRMHFEPLIPKKAPVNL